MGKPALDTLERPEDSATPMHPKRRTVTLPVKILLVEDDNADAELTRLALDRVTVPHTLVQLRMGTDVLPYLKHEGLFTDESAPDLILLDLGLPGEDGFEILEELAELHGTPLDIPVVILTGYEHFSYLKKTYELSVTDYLTKPCSAEQLQTILSRIACQ